MGPGADKESRLLIQVLLLQLLMMFLHMLVNRKQMPL